MIRRALFFLCLNSAASAAIVAFHGFNFYDADVLQWSFIVLAVTLVYVAAPAPFNHLACFLFYSVPLWLLARALQLLAAVGVAFTCGLVLVFFVGLTFFLDWLAYNSFSVPGCLIATTVLATAWILFSAHLRRLLRTIIELLPQFESSFVEPIDDAIKRARESADAFTRWLRT